MSRNLTRVSIWARAFLLALFGLILVATPVYADVAPPESPPGVIISPGSETQVQMVSEVVTMTLAASENTAKTKAAFVMRNSGTQEENIDVQFPLTYGEALYYTNLYPEISDFKVMVAGSPVAAKRIYSTDDRSGKEIPWASFPVTFPPGQDVNIVVTYTAQGFGYEPFLTFRYILETGAGWKDTIGSGDIIFQLPYPASSQNVIIDPESGFAKAAGAPVFSGNEVRWHFSALEPTPLENFQIDLVSSSYWKKIISERKITSENAKDGEAWGRLGKAIKESIRFQKGYFRQDVGGIELYDEALQAYQNSVTLLPKDALWHYGFADLLWSHYYFGDFSANSEDYTELTRIGVELQSSLALNPNYQGSKDLAEWIAGSMPWAIGKKDNGYDFLILTATPTAIPATEAATVEQTPQPLETQAIAQPTLTVFPTKVPKPTLAVSENPTAAISPAPVAKNPICGSILILPLLLGFLWFVSKQK
ncbi:MAG: hypothetical protein WCK35_13730 [Chloroflexota bacterium]